MFHQVFCFVLIFCQFVTTQNYESHFTHTSPLENPTSEQTIRYLFYDVNPPEGFNLRRDVYLRLAVLMNELQQLENWVLVLPPWPHLYHWRTLTRQERLPWAHFFDLTSMRRYAPVIEMLDFLDMHPDATVEKVYILQHFEDMFKSGDFVEKYEVQDCTQPNFYKRSASGLYSGTFWGLNEFSAKDVSCLSYHGHASFIIPLLQNSSYDTVMLDHAEVALHDSYGDANYWRARRSMRFSRTLQKLADDFRRERLNSTNESDGIKYDDDWTRQKPHRSAKGGDYLAVHLRRRDFLQARSKEIPSLAGAVNQIKSRLDQLGLHVVFVATDAPEEEVEELKALCVEENIVMITYQPTKNLLLKIKDGGVAIVEQIICSYARGFIGTYESTFSFRIQEEREILGFPPETSFNRFCGDDQKACQQPAKWLIRF